MKSNDLEQNHEEVQMKQINMSSCFFSTSYPPTEESEKKNQKAPSGSDDKSKAWRSTIKKSNNFKCETCSTENKARLRSCTICQRYKCRNCIRKDDVVKTTKKIRNPSLYICIDCLGRKRISRVKEPNPLLIRSRDNSVEKKSNVSNDSINSIINSKLFAQDIIKHNYSLCLGRSIGICQYCKYEKENILTLKSFFEILINLKYVCEMIEKNNLFVMKQSCVDYRQTVNSILNSHQDFPLETALVLCEDCFSSFLRDGMLVENGIYRTKSESSSTFIEEGKLIPQINFNNLIEIMNLSLNRFFEEFKRNQILFEASLDYSLGKFIQNNYSQNEGLTFPLNCNLIENTLSLDLIHKKSIQLIKDLYINIKNIMQSIDQMSYLSPYSLINYNPQTTTNSNEQTSPEFVAINFSDEINEYNLFKQQ